MSESSKNTALVVGGGLAGMQSALVLAERGHRVVLLDKRPAIGGFFPLLDNQFPTQSCGVCFMACDTPTYCPFVQCELHENVEILPYTSVESVEGEAGAFRVKVAQQASCVDPEKCTDCGACEEVCPVEVTREFGDGLEKRKAVFKYYPKAVAKAYVVDPDSCTRCGKCVEVCDPGAIDLDAKPVAHEVEAASVVLAPGADVFPTSRKEEYGFGRYPDVLSAVRFERMLAAGSPTSGRPVRPSSGTAPRSLAFIQCVGSRDAELGQGHCSSVCCMFALKQAFFARERCPDLGVTVYYMDLRTFGKDYEAYLRRAEALGIRFVRAIPSVIRQVPGSRELLLQIADEAGKAVEAKHDLVVLSSGFCETDETRRLAGAFGVDLADGGFCGGPEFSPCETNVPGVYACGAFREPKDIPESTAEGACAAGLAAIGLAQAADADEPDMPTPADFRAEAPKIGVFLCTCEGFNEQKADFEALAETARGMPGVAFVHTASHVCSKAGMDEVRRVFGEKEPNRVVLAACSYRIVEKLYAHMFRHMGVHPGVLTVANLREACLENPQGMGAGEAGARALLAQAVKEAWYGGFAPVVRETVERTALVVGGGASGLGAALRLADMGHAVHLVEKEPTLGGNLRTARFTVKGGAPGELLKTLESRVKAHPNVRVYTGAKVGSAHGRLGAFRTQVETKEGPVEVLHGAVALATGAGEVKPHSYGYGRSPKVLTQKELEQKLAEGTLPGGKVVMIQCVESREEAEGCRPYCSRVCCTHAVKNALKILDGNPDVEVTVLYRDLRTYGAFEHKYREARDKGVAFVPFDLARRPAVEAQGDTVSVRFTDPGLGGEVTETPDWLVLSAGMAPDAEGNRRLAELYGVETDAHGFFVEKNPKAATTDFAKKGVYMAGLCHAPKHIEESLTQAGAAAARCSALLARGARRSLERASYVVERICSRCGVCVDICPYGARSLDLVEKNVAVVDPLLCEACGACTMACPNKAAQQYGSAPKQVLMGLDELLG
ncbi:MAG: FAD-dependent oxidoreductase [Deferrisomatales bacterium]|nr:FAD-dependent oxidoreductase [Deferrisomatales bacterium]